MVAGHDLDWAAGANPLEDPPLVIMVAFDKYQCPAFLIEEGEEFRDQAGQLVVPILRVRQDFTLKNQTCSRIPLVVSNAITVHKSQGVTPNKVVCAISDVKFASGLHWVAVSRVSKLQGLMFVTEAEFATTLHPEVSKLHGS
jgi:ATP-dependent DNA helicase PIF1